MSNEIFLKATAAAFKEAWRLVDVLVGLNEPTTVNSSNTKNAKGVEGPAQYITVTQAEDVVYVLHLYIWLSGLMIITPVS